MKSSVYFEAAQLLPAADGTEHTIGEHGTGSNVFGCCDAIWGAEHRYPKFRAAMNTGYYGLPDNASVFCDVFKPSNAKGCYWYGFGKDCDEARVLALLFMHWMTVDP